MVDMSLLDYDGQWSFIIQISILMVFLLIGNVLSKKVPFLKKLLFPTAVLGGLLILLFKFIPVFSEVIDNSLMTTITYHALGLGFVATGLKVATTKRNNGKHVHKTGLLTVNGYLLQGIIGVIITMALSVTLFDNLFFSSGLLLPMGFGQGPGQALNFGTMFEGKGFEFGSGFGLTIATVGFLVSCIVGVTYQNYLKSKNKLLVREPSRNQVESLVSQTTENEIPLNENVDKFTINMAIVLGVYFVGFLVIFGLSFLATSFLGGFGESDVVPLLYGFNYLFGLAFAMVYKKVMKVLKEKKIVEKDYTNNFILDRISGFFFDIMIVASIASLALGEMSNLIVPLLLVCGLGAVGTFFYIRYSCNRIFKGYENEMFFAQFGQLTGTLSSGMILLRQIDPNYETPAADNMAVQSLPAIAYGFPLFFLVPFAANGIWQAFTVLGIIIVLFVSFNFIMFYKTKNAEQIYFPNGNKEASSTEVAE